MHTKIKPLCVANWKMNLSFDKTYEFCTTYADRFKTLSSHHDIQLVLCPSPESLALTAHIFKDSTVKIGAQNCSHFQAGPYTGEISAQSLAQIGCKYSIIGHSERRIFFHETNETIALKTKNLLNASVIPIVCIGEPQPTESMQEIFDYLLSQLDPIFHAIASLESQLIIIAYEPVWSIGTGVIPSIDHLTKIFKWLHNLCTQQTTPSGSYSFLYGGSIHAQNINCFKHIAHLDGFLVGNASLDFQNFEKIVSLISV
jgi:triosephosphate isomerase (TIM)